uniref:Hydroxysteroid 17-beta dehydrogenase 2 n=1 Tax=Malurus cyaneus samueli TaxID=2593467 RepID=A0A8C5T8N3_9PASS
MNPFSSEILLTTYSQCRSRSVIKTLPSSFCLNLPGLPMRVFILYTFLMVMQDRLTLHNFLTLSGSDSGIGHALAKHLDSLGFVVFAGVLDKDGPGAQELRQSCSPRLCVLQLDITSTTQVKEAYLTISEQLQNAGLWGLVNNAGILGFPADGELLPMSTYRHCMEVNFFGAVQVSKTFLPLLRKSRGRLVNMSSMAGGIPLPRYAAYGASKAALSMFSGVMRQELSKWGIKVAAIHPSGFRTGWSEQWDEQEQELLASLAAETRSAYGEEYLLGLRSYLVQLPSHCAPDLSPVLAAVLHALLATRPHGLYTPGKGAYIPLFIFCCFPLWFYDFFISKYFTLHLQPNMFGAWCVGYVAVEPEQ